MFVINLIKLIKIYFDKMFKKTKNYQTKKILIILELLIKYNNISKLLDT